MDYLSIKLALALSEGRNLKKIFRQQVEQALNLLLESGRTAFLCYKAWSPEGYNNGNARNGYYKHNLKTDLGELELEVPCYHLGTFQQQAL